MAVTIQKIAELAGVSRGTVDRVLHGRGRVDDEVAARVLQIAQEAGYRTRTQKKALRETDALSFIVKTRRIGVVTQLSGASFMLSIRKGLLEAKEEARAYGIEVEIRECSGVDGAQQCQALRELEETGIDALAIMPVECEEVRSELRRLISEKNLEVLTFNTDIVGAGRVAFLGMDNRQGGKVAAGLLGLLLRGRGSVIGIIGSFSNSTSLLRIDGFTEELAQSFPEISMAGVRVSMDSREEVASIIRDALRSQPDLGGIMMVSSGQMGIQDALEDPEVQQLLESRPDGKRPYIVIYDLTPRNRELLEKDAVDFVIDQDGYHQGSRAVMTLVSLLSSGLRPQQEYMYTDITIRTRYTSPAD